MLNELSLVSQSQFRSEVVAFLVLILGCSLRSFIRVALIGSLWDLILSFRSSMPGRRSVGCIGSKLAFLCGVVCFPTYLTGWVNSFRLSLGSFTVLVVVAVAVVIVDVAVRVRVIGVTAFVSRIILVFFQFILAVFSTSDTDFCNVLVFYSSGTLGWVCRH